MAGLGGSPYSRLSQMMGKYGYNKAVDIEIGSVISPEPNLIVKMDSSPIELDKDDLLLCKHLTNHKRTILIDGQQKEIEYLDGLKAGDRVIMAWLDEQMRAVVFDRAYFPEGG